MDRLSRMLAAAQMGNIGGAQQGVCLRSSASYGLPAGNFESEASILHKQHGKNRS